ncbi:MAG TPA: hypothetical protein ENG99_00455, partial [bacterium]|nr:hypothetical protein [bacterium]
LVGKPYKYGASVTFDAPDCFDCSSFVGYVFAHSGIQIPRMTIDQYFFGEAVHPAGRDVEKDLKPGDLVFSNSGNGKIHYETKEFMKGQKIKEGIDHVGIYLGKGKIIHASRYNTDGIVIEDIKKAKQFKNSRGFRRIIHKDSDLVLVTVPYERLDILGREDLIEEIARIYGYEKIPAKLPEEILFPSKRNDNFFYAEIIRNILIGAGFSEIYNYSFNPVGDIEIMNPIAKDKKYLRINLLDGLAKIAKENLRYFPAVKIFEIGEVFPSHGETISLAVFASNATFYEMKGLVEDLLNELGISDIFFQDHPDKVADIRVGNTSIGLIDHIGWEINFEMLVRLATEEVEYRPISRYPAVKRDISVFVPLKTKVIEVLDVIENTAGMLLIDTDLFDIYELPDEDRNSFAFHLIFQSQEKTLSEEEINELMNKIMDALDANVEWEVRR